MKIQLTWSRCLKKCIYNECKEKLQNNNSEYDIRRVGKGFVGK